MFAGIFTRCSSGIRKSSRKLQIGAVVELRQSFEAELPDPRGAQLAPGLPGLGLDALDDLLQPARIDVPLARGPDQRGTEPSRSNG